ncbi:MAG: phosphotransferase, partial [Acinetobacter pittii]
MSVEQNEFLSQVQLQILAEQAIKQYPSDYQGQVKLLCQSENATFQISTGSARYALRIHRPNYHSKLDIQSELEWLDALNASGIQVPVAIADQSGERVITLKLSNDIYRYAVLFNWVEGDMPTVEVDPTAFEQLGSSEGICAFFA